MQIDPGWTPVQPGEIDFFGIDFGKELGGAGISGAVWAASVYQTRQPAEDPNPNNIVSGSPFVLNTTQTWVQITGGVSGIIYRMDVTVTTTDARILKNWAILPCSQTD